jgi:FAD/FMN-containing dehydrogenase
LPDGDILDLNTKLHKKNTGLDLKQLFIGTGGQYGIITECVVKLSYRPQQTATSLIIPDRNEAIPQLLQKVEKSFGDHLSAFEGMSKNAIEAAFAHHPTGLKNAFANGIPDYVCLIELSRTWALREGETSLDEVLQAGLANIIEEEGLIKDALFGRPEEHWQLRHALSEGVQKSGTMIGFDISFARDQAVMFRSFMQKALPEKFPNIKICDFGHIGDGAMHFNLVLDPHDKRLKQKDFVSTLKNWVFEKVVKDFNGCFSAEHGIGPNNLMAFENYTPEKIQKISRQLKEILK